jgi:hypothetical protein
MSDLDGMICMLKDRSERLEKGDELCNHHWNGSDGCYETYCTGCGKHLAEERNELYIPFADEAYCFSCQQTPEEKETERLNIIKRKKEKDIKALTELIKEYSAEAREILNKP